MCIYWCLIAAVEELKNEDEEVDNVEIKLNGRHDVVVGSHSIMDHVCVENDVERENDGTRHTVAIVQVCCIHRYINTINTKAKEAKTKKCRQTIPTRSNEQASAREKEHARASEREKASERASARETWGERERCERERERETYDVPEWPKIIIPKPKRQRITVQANNPAPRNEKSILD